MLINRIKLAKMLLKLASVATDKGELIYEGELVEGIEVFIEKDGEIVVAEDGEYKLEDKILVVSEGKVTEIRDIESEEPKQEDVEQEAEEPKEENDSKVAELEARIAELEKVISEKDERIADLESKLADKDEEIKQKDEQLQMSAEKPAKEKIKKNEKQGALRFF